MGLEPTKYRCGAESLLRRFRKGRALPAIHPMIDLCDAISLAHATPIAVFDLAKVDGDLEVRYADGSESYLTFGGETEHPEPGEVVFADTAGNAHARRWTNRQSGLSGISGTTESVLVVAEALHEGARDDIGKLIEAVAAESESIWSAKTRAAVLTASAPVFATR